MNETYARVSWRADRIPCNKWLLEAKYELSMKQDGLEILSEDIRCGTSTKTLRNLRPKTKYEVIITEIFGMKRSHRTFRHRFETTEISK